VHKTASILAAAAALAAASFHSARAATDTSSTPSSQTNRWWNVHVQNTDIFQWQPSFPAQYSGPNSLNSRAQTSETVDLDAFAGVRLWKNAEFHLDALYWQGFGLSKTLGVEAFPSASAYKIGNNKGNFAVTRAFIRQTINLGGDEIDVADDALHLAGKVDASRVVLTVGEISVLDIFDVNSYAGDPGSQFLNWAFVGNEGWDYPANSLGYITGFAGELYQPGWAVRYGFFQLPSVANGMAIDKAYLDAWGMVTEVERDFHLGSHPGAVRLGAFLNRARMGSYSEALDNPIRPADITLTRAYRLKYGFMLNAEQEIIDHIGVFSRLGWNDGQQEGWAYSDVDYTLSAGFHFDGALWMRPSDSIGLAGVMNGLSVTHRRYLEAGGLGVLDGDGALDYGWEKTLECYYNFAVWKSIHLTADYQFIDNPANNRARGPVSVLGGRLHWEF
jgi:high affinity Mn2+ porin